MLTCTRLNATLPYATQDELDWIREFASQLVEGSTVVMVGAGPGVFALALHEGLTAPIDFYIIDIDTCKWVDAHLQSAEVDTSKIFFIVADSANIGETWGDETIDLLIIDGDHSYEGVLRDIDAWWSSVKDGGTVFFHDYLHRDGGFTGSGDWLPSEVYTAIEDRKTEEWQGPTTVGISAVFTRRKG